MVSRAKTATTARRERAEQRARELLLPPDAARRFVGLVADATCPDCGCIIGSHYETSLLSHARVVGGLACPRPAERRAVDARPERRDCRVCGGAGYLATEPSPAPCRYCGGTGWERQP